MSLLLSELVRDPVLGLRVLAGDAGLGRAALWAHACELASPWDWLEPGDMLLSNGFSIPDDADGQARYVARLDDAGIVGLVIGESQQAPELLAATVALADERGFPILECAFRVPFVAVAKAVGLATIPTEQAQLQQIVRVYGRAREAAAREQEGASMLDAVAKELGCRLWVLDPATGGGLLPSEPVPPGLRDALRDAYGERGGKMPAAVRLGDGSALAVPVPSRRAATLVATGRDGDGPPALALLQHVATVAGLDVERAEAERERRRRLGSELLAHALDGRLDAVSATHVLAEHDFAPGDPLAIVVISEPVGDELGAALDARLGDERIPHLILRRERELHLLVPYDDAVFAVVSGALVAPVVAGISEPLDGLGRIRDAVREAHLARADRDERGIDGDAGGLAGLAFYGRQRSYFLPTTVRDAEAVAAHVLGAVLDYDREHGTSLVETVEAFLVANRSWQRTALALHLHRQTLVYRVRRFEEISGRKLDDTGDVAELWLALRAFRLSRGDGPPAG